MKIIRGSKSIVIPRGDEPIYPYDKLLAVGTSEQIESFNRVMNKEFTTLEALKNSVVEENSDFTVEAVQVCEDSFINGKTLRELCMRDSGCMVLSVLRGDEFITNPKAEFRFEAGDTAWIAGEKDSIHFFA